MSESSDKEADILLRRARELAEPALAEVSADAADEELIRMSVGGVHYALPLSIVREVARAVKITPLPLAPAPFAGLARVRGRLIAVFALDRLVLRGGAFSAEKAPNAPARLVVVCGRDDDELGLAVDDVSVERAVAIATESGAEPLLRGVLPSGALLLDARALFDDPRAHASHSLPGIES